MRIDDAIHGLMAVSKRTVMLIAWLLVALLHLAALSIALVLLWWLQVTPQEIRAWADSFFHQGPIATIAETVGLLGLSLGAALWAYAKGWQWLLQRMATKYVLTIE